jgi:hypothetical protein
LSSLVDTASAIVAAARRIADRVTHPNREYRHTRGTAALVVSEAIGVPYSEETLRKSGCPYISVAGHVLYADDDLIALATDILARAQKRGSTKPRVNGGLAGQTSHEGREQRLGFSRIVHRRTTGDRPKKLKRGGEERESEEEAR